MGKTAARPARDARFALIETLRWDGTRLHRLDRHLARAANSAAELGIACEPARIRAALAAVGGPAPLRVRLTIDAASGAPAVTTAPLPPSHAPWRVALAEGRLDPADPWLRHKTTRRVLYDEARAALPAGLDEFLFLNTRGELCEGTITNLFFDLGSGLCTPPLACGLLPGILRAELLGTGRCREASLQAAELARARLWVGNSLRGLIPARLAAMGD